MSKVIKLFISILILNSQVHSKPNRRHIREIRSSKTINYIQQPTLLGTRLEEPRKTYYALGKHIMDVEKYPDPPSSNDLEGNNLNKYRTKRQQGSYQQNNINENNKYNTTDRNIPNGYTSEYDLSNIRESDYNNHNNVFVNDVYNKTVNNLALNGYKVNSINNINKNNYNNSNGNTPSYVYPVGYDGNKNYQNINFDGNSYVVPLATTPGLKYANYPANNSYNYQSTANILYPDSYNTISYKNQITYYNNFQNPTTPKPYQDTYTRAYNNINATENNIYKITSAQNNKNFITTDGNKFEITTKRVFDLRNFFANRNKFNTPNRRRRRRRTTTVSPNKIVIVPSCIMFCTSSAMCPEDQVLVGGFCVPNRKDAIDYEYYDEN